MTAANVDWGGARIKLTWKEAAYLPEREFITSAHGFCFLEGKVLLVNLQNRGWDIPGGHIEKGESPKQCFKREAMEEGYAEGQCAQLGYIIVDHSENLQWTESSVYPKIGYQVFYHMEIERMYDFEARYESSERKLVDPLQITEFCKGWHETLAEALNSAMKRSSSIL
ncbi:MULTISPECIES: NUDIX hydrolase [Cytobacillus]|uniref:NUDIX hydrolase n=1 Tax=Cytobacillus TaxID=2675230 RepID=UPI00203A8411|nr:MULTISPECIES: NUDIX domain-containing protein [Cytobacillus]MCM3393388.1 NUDIX domain-containing protein [Cytobacillus oceanisediminis]UQX54862.1 NUDIX domain-containing protein [Cytobacillus pseudoceanisediminis]